MKIETDSDLDVAMFLSRHPGWSYTDLLATPDDIVEFVRMIDFERTARG